MLKEWLRNMPLERLLAIVNTLTPRSGVIGRLAAAELARRRQMPQDAAS